MGNPKAIYWTDIETTGLDPVDDSILEIAMSRAPFEDPWNAVPIGHFVLHHDDFRGVDKFVIDMHCKSGLVNECLQSDVLRSVTISQARDAELTKLLGGMVVLEDFQGEKDSRPVFGGSSVHFDRSFLIYQAPTFARAFSHRSFDVSALKLVCRSLGMPKQKMEEAHRAKADVEESIRHGKECVEWLREKFGDARELDLRREFIFIEPKTGKQPRCRFTSSDTQCVREMGHEHRDTDIKSKRWHMDTFGRVFMDGAWRTP